MARLCAGTNQSGSLTDIRGSAEASDRHYFNAAPVLILSIWW
nr:MAG TPA: hypothetical protein [Caudoviricetes sp.]